MRNLSFIRNELSDLVQENQMYNCGADVAVDAPSYNFAKLGNCELLCNMAYADLSCSFTARFGESLLSMAPEAGEERKVLS